MNVFRKITTGVGAVALLCFSFYYTAMAAKFLRGNDELMLEIKSVASTYETGAIDASFNGDEMIPGLAGQKVDYDKSYSKMKNYGILNELDLVFTSVEPNSSIENVYDKYIVKGNDAKKAVALVFLVTDETYLEEINNILLTNDVPATFFLESNYIKNNKDFVKDLSVTNEIEPLGSSATYDKETILYDVSLIETITDLPAKYCFTKYANSDTLKVCSDYQLQTVRPTILTGNYPLTKIKNNLTNGAIISFDMTSIVRKELSVSINYIRQKGYDFLTLSELLSEEMK